MPAISKLSKNLLLVYTAQALNGIVGVVAVPLTVKLLGAAGYGLLSIYGLMSSYVLLADFGISKNLLRLLSATTHAETQTRHIRVVLGMYVVLCTAWLMATPILSFVVSHYVFPVSAQYAGVLRWMPLVAVMEFILGVPASVMQTACVARQRFELYAGYSVATGLTRNGALIAAAILFPSPLVIAIALALRKVIDGLVAGSIMGWIGAPAWRPVFELSGFRRMLSQSLRLSTAQVLQSTVMNIGSPLVNAVFGLQALGFYRAAFDVAGKIAVVSNGVTLVVFPRAARYFGSTARLERDSSAISVIMRCSATVYGCFAAGAVLAAPHILPFIGLKQDLTVRLFILLIIALSLNAHSLLGNELLQAAGTYLYSIYLNAGALVVLCVTFVAMKPAAGAMAIGWAWIGAALLSACFADGLLLSLFKSPAVRQATTLLAKVAATGACVALAGHEFRVFPATAAVSGGLTLLLLLGWSLRDSISLLRAWNAKPVSEPAIAAIYA